MPVKRVLIGVLLLAVSACNLPTGQSTRADLVGTITAQALTLQARTGTAAQATESPAVSAETGTPTGVTVPATSAAAATDPPQPTKTPKATKTPKPTATPAETATATGGPIAPFVTGAENLSCTATTLNGQPAWRAEVKVHWNDKSSDEEYFLLG